MPKENELEKTRKSVGRFLRNLVDIESRAICYVEDLSYAPLCVEADPQGILRKGELFFEAKEKLITTYAKTKDEETLYMAYLYCVTQLLHWLDDIYLLREKNRDNATTTRVTR